MEETKVHYHRPIELIAWAIMSAALGQFYFFIINAIPDNIDNSTDIFSLGEYPGIIELLLLATIPFGLFVFLCQCYFSFLEGELIELSIAKSLLAWFLNIPLLALLFFLFNFGFNIWLTTFASSIVLAILTTLFLVGNVIDVDNKFQSLFVTQFLAAAAASSIFAFTDNNFGFRGLSIATIPLWQFFATLALAPTLLSKTSRPAIVVWNAILAILTIGLLIAGSFDTSGRQYKNNKKNAWSKALVNSDQEKIKRMLVFEEVKDISIRDGFYQAFNAKDKESMKTIVDHAKDFNLGILDGLLKKVESPEMAQFLIDLGGLPNMIRFGAYGSNVPASFIVKDIEVMKIFLENGVDVNEVHEFNERYTASLLHVALNSKDTLKAAFLLEHGADPSSVIKERINPRLYEKYIENRLE